MRVNLLLADSGEVDPGGKLHALGIGWATTISPTPPMVVLLLLQIMPDETDIFGHPLTINVSLRGQDGEQFLVPDSGGNDNTIQIHGEATMSPPPQPQAGLPVSSSLVLTIGPGIPLPEQKVYSWKVVITAKGNDKELASDSAVFFVSKRSETAKPPQAHSQA